jgi:hypothetical protein
VGAAALYFDLPFPNLRAPAAVLYLVVIMVALRFLRHGRTDLIVVFAGFVLVALWWFSLKPSNERNWRPDNAKTAYADINGEQATIHDFRNCDYRTENDYTCRWEVRSYNLANLRGADIFITWWGSPWIAHPNCQLRFRRPGPCRHVHRDA